MILKVLDLFSGLKGFSKAFKDNGHEVLTIDINPKFNPDICKDILEIKWYPWIYFDVILASPPCTEFTKSDMPWYKNINPDLSLILKTKEIIDYLKPKFWVIENVRGARKYFIPILGQYKKKCGSRYLWGNFPDFPCNQKKCYHKESTSPGPLQAAKRSLIPYEISYNLCLAIEKLIRKEGDK